MVVPSFLFDSVEDAYRFAAELPDRFAAVKAEAEATTSHGRLERLVPHAVGRTVMVAFHYYTADAQGMNMIVKATDRAARWLVASGLAPRYQIFSGLSSEKRASGYLLAGVKGKKVVAGARIPAAVLAAYMRVTPQAIAEVWRHTAIGHFQAGAIGFNAHYANGLTALFIACARMWRTATRRSDHGLRSHGGG